MKSGPSNTSAWKALRLPLGRQIGGVVCLNGELYIIAGACKNLLLLDKNMKWIDKADLNVSREWIANSCVECDGYIWVLGGENDKSWSTSSVERYDPKEDKWTLMP